MADNSLFFHETFQPEVTYLSKILELAVENESGDKYRISEITGIPTGEKKGKVEPHIKYAKYMGLIDYTCNRGIYCLKATELGEVIWNQDKYLHETLTLWLLHYNISRNVYGAPAWKYVVKEMNCGFNEKISGDHANSLLQKGLGISGTDVAKYTGVVKNSYMTGCFANLYFLNWDDSVSYDEKTEQVEYLYIYAYVLLDSWNIEFPNKKEITMAEIIDSLCLGKVFGLNDEDIDSVLSTLQDKGIISINRQLYPVTIVRTSEITDVLDRLYSLLM